MAIGKEYLLFWNLSEDNNVFMLTSVLRIWHFNTDRTLTRNGGDDADAKGGQAQCDIIFQVLDPGYAHTRCRDDLIQCDRRTNGG